jgi:5-aminopentanamidase
LPLLLMMGIWAFALRYAVKYGQTQQFKEEEQRRHNEMLEQLLAQHDTRLRKLEEAQVSNWDIAQACYWRGAPMSTGSRLRVALLHLAPVPGNLGHNRDLIERAMIVAAQNGATWIVTPELAVCGYTFAQQLGTDWIVPQPDRWMSRIRDFAAAHRTTVFLATPERDDQSERLHNSIFVIGEDGRIIGRHRKINTLRVGSEAWSSPGQEVVPVNIPQFGSVGLLICADACSPRIGAQLREANAQLLVSAAAWAPGAYGPNGEWERLTLNTGIPLIVCNRTGRDRVMDFTGAESVIARNGKRVLSLSSATSVIFLLDWKTECHTLSPDDWRRIDL